MQGHFHFVAPFKVWGRWLFWLGFYASILLGWIGLMAMTASPMPGLTAAQYWAALCISAQNADPWALFAMWGLMSAAMMLPSFVPAARVFDELGSVGAANGASMAALVLGYGTVWLMFSALAATTQLGLAQLGAISASGQAAGQEVGQTFGQAVTPWASAGLLATAGAYQFSTAKHACLAKCRHPLTFFMQYWAAGLKPAFTMGARLGLWCVGCCWLLMLLGLIGGAMNLLWMGAATVFMVVEKLPDLGRYITKPLGGALILGAGVQIYLAISTGG